MFTRVLDHLIERVNCCPWQGLDGGSLTVGTRPARAAAIRRPYLYSTDERRRRDATRWTLVQGILAPIQFAVFLVSLALVLRYLATGEGLAFATGSILVKTLVLYTIMITGSIWEHKVFGRYLFAPAFFWEDMFSILVLGLHTLYVATLITGGVTAQTQTQMTIALAAYATYAINAGQFVMKLRMARLEGPAPLTEPA